MFDAAQGQIFQARFDNELLSGTLEADSTNAVNGLTGILNHDTGAALAKDMAMLNAAGAGFVADARDVSGNNMAIGGATYVGTAKTVSTATSVHGLAQGTIPVTATPNIANGTGGAAATTTTTTTTVAPAVRLTVVVLAAPRWYWQHRGWYWQQLRWCWQRRGGGSTGHLVSDLLTALQHDANATTATVIHDIITVLQHDAVATNAMAAIHAM